MRLKQKKKAQILSVSDRDPEVVGVSGNNIFLRVFFEVDALAAIESDSFLYGFRLMNSQVTIEKKRSLTALESSSALNSSTGRKTNVVKMLKSIIYESVVDITKFIPNDRIGKILAGDGVRRRKLIKTSNTDDKSSAKIPSSKSSVDMDFVSNEKDVTPFRVDSIYRKCQDPAKIVNDVKFHSPIQRSVRGLRTTGDMSKLDKKTQQFRKMMTLQTRSSKSVRLEDENPITIEIPVDFSVVKSKLSTYTVEIDALHRSSSNAPPKILQTLTFQADLNEAYQEYIVPTTPPIVQITSIPSGRSFRITQQDVNGTSVKIYRRFISGSEVSNIGFSLVATLSAKKDQEVFYVDRNVSASKCIYRVVTFNELDMTSGVFTSLVVPGMKVIEKKHHPDTTAILAYEDGGSVKVKAFNIPNDTVALRLVRKNLTTHEPEYSSPSSIDGSSLKQIERSTSEITFVDLAKRPDTIYSYRLMLVDVYGNERMSENQSIVKFVGDESAQKSRTLISSAATVNVGSEPSVNFQVNAPTDEASLDKIYSILVDAGVSDLYGSELKQNKELLSQLVALEMMRFDTSTGRNESFGVVNIGGFQDGSDTRRKANVSKLIPGRTYIYQYRLLVRSSGTIFSGTSVDRKDLETLKSYSTNLKKFNSPKTLKRGTLSSTADQIQAVTKTGLKFGASDSSDAEMLAGVTSLTGQATIKMPLSDTYVESLQTEETTRGNVLRWRLVEGTNQIDHIIVMAEYNGQRAPLRAIHFCGNDKMMYLDDETKASLNDVSYYVLPVFTDFKQGNVFGPAEIT